MWRTNLFIMSTEPSSTGNNPTTHSNTTTPPSGTEAISTAAAVASTDTPAPEVTPVTPAPVQEVVDRPTPASTSDTTTVIPTAVPVSPKTPSKRRVLVKQYGITALIVLLMGLVLWYLLEEQGRVNTGVFDAVKAVIMPVPTALVVNDQKISMTEFDRGLAQLRLQVPPGTTTPEIETALRDQTIELLTRAALLEQAAMRDGVVITDEQVDARFAEIESRQGGADGLAARLAELSLTEEQLRRDIRQELLIQTHLGTAIDSSEVAITDIEIETFYNNVKAQNPDVPPLAEVREQIVEELRFGKQQELITAYIESLRSEATIENRLAE